MKFGMIGTGRIAHRFASEIRYVSGAELEIVYNPNRKSGERFAERFGIPSCTEELPNFLHTDIDAVYIASPHDTHYEYVKEALLAGKHVLCEKPLALEELQARELFGLAEKNKLCLMEAMKTAYCPGFRKIEEVIRKGTIGRVTDVDAAFTRITPSNTREYLDVRSGGSFTEFGSYALLPIFRFLGTEYSEIRFMSVKTPNGTDSYTRAVFSYENGAASAKTGLSVKSEGQLLISGTKGYILVPSPWWLTKYFEVRFEDPNRIERVEAVFEEAGLRYEIRAFKEAAERKEASGSGEEPSEYFEAAEGPRSRSVVTETIMRARVMEEFLKDRHDKTPGEEEKKKVRIWAHRGCSMVYPENTLPAFEAAAKLPGLTGIELDVQRTKDGELVVIHDEKVDRVAEGAGFVKDLTLSELQSLKLKQDETGARIPSFREVLALLKPYCESKGLRINVELKTGKVRYEGIENQVLEMIREYDLMDHVVFSSFLQDSIRIVKNEENEAETGMLSYSIEDCIRLGKEVCADAYHPSVGGLGSLTESEETKIRNAGIPIRAFNGEEPLYGSGRELKSFDLREYTSWGVTDIFTNVPERYLT